MTKEEKIQEAYGCDVSGLVDNNGWTIYGSDEFGECGVEPFGEYETKNHIDGKYEWRPKSLQGIENNNGWIKIESQEDLPKESGNFWIVSRYGTIMQADYIQNRKVFFRFGDITVTHHQPIQKPQPPIY